MTNTEKLPCDVPVGAVQTVGAKCSRAASGGVVMRQVVFRARDGPWSACSNQTEKENSNHFKECKNDKQCADYNPRRVWLLA